MKPPVIILAIVCLVLGGLLFMNSRSAKAQLQETRETILTYSNQVTELKRSETRLMMEKGDMTVAVSNLQAQAELSTHQLASCSNRLAATRTELTANRDSLRTTQRQLDARTAEVETLQAQRAGLQHQLAGLQAAQRELEPLREQLLAQRQKVSVLLAELGAQRLEYQNLLSQLEDPGYLERQLAKAEDFEKARRRAAKTGPTEKPDRRAPLVLQPDGTVRAAALTSK